MPDGLVDLEIKEKFSMFGPILLFMPVGPGALLVRFSSKHSAAVAVASLNGTYWKDKLLSVQVRMQNQ